MGLGFFWPNTTVPRFRKNLLIMINLWSWDPLWWKAVPEEIVSMKTKELLEIRRQLGKTQAQMAQLLCVSLKAIKSFEQGWRDIPTHIERQALFLLASKLQNKKQRTCWEVKACPLENRRRCPSWEFQVGHLCWFMNGTFCQGEKKQSWKEKMKLCRECQVFISIFRSDNGWVDNTKVSYPERMCNSQLQVPYNRMLGFGWNSTLGRYGVILEVAGRSNGIWTRW